MKRLLTISALVEALTGVILLISPALVVRLLFGAEIAGAGVNMSRLAGITLIALGVACWSASALGRAFHGMFTYNALATLYLAYLGLGREWTGVLLWPAVVVHAGFTTLLAKAWAQQRKVAEAKA